MIIKPKLSQENIQDKNELIKKLSALKSGRVLDALVLKVLGEDRAEIRLLGQRMIVETEKGLEEGAKILLKAAKNSSGKLILQLMEDMGSGIKEGNKDQKGNFQKPLNEPSRFIDDTQTYGKILKQERVLKDYPFQEKTETTHANKDNLSKVPIKSAISSYPGLGNTKPTAELLLNTKFIESEKPVIQGTTIKAQVLDIKSDGTVVLDFNGTKAEAKLQGLSVLAAKAENMPFKKGEPVELVVRQNNGKEAILTPKTARPISRILISSADIVPEKPPQTDIKDGDVLKAKVIDLPQKRSALINIKGEDIPVRINTPLKKGENLLLRASVKQGNLSFRIVSNESQPSLDLKEGLLKAMGKAGPFENLEEILRAPEKEIQSKNKDSEHVELLRRLVKDISLKSGRTDVDILRTIVKNSGMTLENKLASALKNNIGINSRVFIENDLKALTMQFLKKFGDDSDTGIKIKSFVETMEQMQLLNRHSSDDSGKYLMPVPVFGNEMFRFGQLLIDLNSQGKSDKKKRDRVLRVSFMLEMTNLGDLRADFSMLKKGITGAFGVETEGAKRIIKKGLPELEKSLNKHGFAVHKIDCFVLDENTLKNKSLTDEILDERNEKSGEEILNIVI